MATKKEPEQSGPSPLMPEYRREFSQVRAKEVLGQNDLVVWISCGCKGHASKKRPAGPAHVGGHCCSHGHDESPGQVQVEKPTEGVKIR